LHARPVKDAEVDGIANVGGKGRKLTSSRRKEEGREQETHLTHKEVKDFKEKLISFS
jgi:hypothetical protein